MEVIPFVFWIPSLLGLSIFSVIFLIIGIMLSAHTKYDRMSWIFFVLSAICFISFAGIQAVRDAEHASNVQSTFETTYNVRVEDSSKSVPRFNGKTQPILLFFNNKVNDCIVSVSNNTYTLTCAEKIIDVNTP